MPVLVSPPQQLRTFQAGAVRAGRAVPSSPSLLSGMTMVMISYPT